MRMSGRLVGMTATKFGGASKTFGPGQLRHPWGKADNAALVLAPSGRSAHMERERGSSALAALASVTSRRRKGLTRQKGGKAHKCPAFLHLIVKGHPREAGSGKREHERIRDKRVPSQANS